MVTPIVTDDPGGLRNGTLQRRYYSITNKHTCRFGESGIGRSEGGWKFPDLTEVGSGNFRPPEVRPIPESPNLQVCLVFSTCHFGIEYRRIYAFMISCLDNEHFSRQHTTQTNKLRLKLKLKKLCTIFPYSWKEKRHTFCENIANNHGQNVNKIDRYFGKIQLNNFMQVPPLPHPMLS